MLPNLLLNLSTRGLARTTTSGGVVGVKVVAGGEDVVGVAVDREVAVRGSASRSMAADVHHRAQHQIASANQRPTSTGTKNIR